MKKINVNKNWSFSKLPEQSIKDISSLQDIKEFKGQAVNIPHSWYSDDDQYQGLAIYRKEIICEADWKHAFLEFEGVEQQCKIFINGVYAGGHKGSYATFRIEVPSEVLGASKLDIVVLVENKICDSLSPMFGDFTIFGGIYRDVALLITGDDHFDYMYYGTNGLIVRAECCDAECGVLHMEPHTVCVSENIEINYIVKNDKNQVVANCTGGNAEKKEIRIANPALWNGREDKAFYYVTAQMLLKGEIVDAVEVRVAFRNIVLDAQKGLFLNGKHVFLKGVAKHQDFAECQNAITKEQIDTDFKLIEEIGANAIRLSHYQHAQSVYDSCDEKGYLVWAEIPMLKMTDNEELFVNVKEQLKELILQNIHHPSIYCWGIQNEIAMFRDSELLHKNCREMTQLSHELDPYRVSAGANLYSVKAKSEMNAVTDIVGYNLYFGWYYGEMQDYRGHLDKLHEVRSQVPLGISEYGVDASPFLHSATPRVKDYSEEYQALFHETVYPIFEEKEYLWGSFVWNMFDFSSARRNEGGSKYVNAKGLVTRDRMIKKDAFYYYKAKWSVEPFVHICSKRFAKRSEDVITIKAYTNQEEAILLVNDMEFARGKNNGNGIILFDHVPLEKAENQIVITAKELSDQCVFQKVSEPEESYALPEEETGGMVRNWFLTDDEFTKEGYYSVLNRADELLDCAETRKVLEEYVPALVKFMTEKDLIPLGLEMKSILSRESTPEMIREINKKLNQIKED